MTNDDKAAATKQDIQLLMLQMTEFRDDVIELREGVTELRKGMTDSRRENRQWKKDIIGEFHIFTGQLLHDFRGAFGDRVSQHEDRINRLERHTGLLAA